MCLIHILLFSFLCLSLEGVHGDYDCMCNYNVEKAVYGSPTVQGPPPIGYLYEFDCKAKMDPRNGWMSVAFEHKVGFIEPDENIQEQICSGSVPDEDNVTTQMPTTQSTTTPTTTTPKTTTSTTTSTTTTPTTTSTTTTPTTTSTTTTPTTTSTTTTPTTTSTTTTPTTTSTTTTPTTTSTTTTPTTTSTTTTPTTTSTTTTPTTTSTTTTPTTTSTTTTPTTTSTTTTPTTTSTTTTPTTTSTTTTPTTTSTTTTPTTTSTTTTPTTTSTTTTPTTTSTTTTPTTTSTTTTPTTTSTTTTPTTTSTTTTPTTTSTTTTPTTTSTTTTPTTTSTTTTPTTASTPSTPTTIYQTTPVPISCVDLLQSVVSIKRGELFAFRNKCYQIIKVPADWVDAEVDCRKMKGHLVSIYDSNEQVVVHKTLMKHYNQSVWIGLHDIHHEETFEWTSGAVFSYTNWVPDRMGDDHIHEDCVALETPTSKGYWEDDKCIEARGYVCEWENIPAAAPSIG